MPVSKDKIMSEINALAALEAKAQLTPFTYKPHDLKPDDIEISISHCGICHSDLHLIDNDWRNAQFPLIPGHEIVGKVTAIGSAVAPDLMGKRVGVGWQRSSCMTCEYCATGFHQLCAKNEPTTVTNYGGFAEKIIIDHHFAFPIPEQLASNHAAPLLCAGVTVYTPLHKHLKPGMRVGVIGIGGLGHLGVQFAKAMGMEVLAFTSNPAKADEARQLGATEIANSRDKNDFKKFRRSLDFILCTVSVNLDWGEYMKLLKPNGTLCFVGAVMGDIAIPAYNFPGFQMTVTGGSIGGRGDMFNMLNFAAKNNIAPWIEEQPFDNVNQAIARLRKNDVRYRFVLEH